MGYPMARNLLRAGHEVALWSNTTDKAQKLAAEDKGRFCERPAKWRQNADVIFLCVGTTEMSKQVILGEDGLIEGLQVRGRWWPTPAPSVPARAGRSARP